MAFSLLQNFIWTQRSRAYAMPEAIVAAKSEPRLVDQIDGAHMPERWQSTSPDLILPMGLASILLLIGMDQMRNEPSYGPCATVLAFGFD